MKPFFSPSRLIGASSAFETFSPSFLPNSTLLLRQILPFTRRLLAVRRRSRSLRSRFGFSLFLVTLHFGTLVSLFSGAGIFFSPVSGINAPISLRLLLFSETVFKHHLQTF